MSVEAMVQAEGGTSTGHGLSVLDIVKHAMKTIIGNLQATDRLALVAYSNDAKTIFGLTEMDDAARQTTEAKLEELIPEGMTNIWDGLRVAMDLLKTTQQPGRLQHVMLFTDGLPNINPPRGILPMLKRQKDKEGGKLPCTISTFGFGYELDSELLSEMAILGSGLYAFIPDAGFVGTTFVNAMTNLLVTMGKDTTLTLTPINGASFAPGLVMGGHPTTQAGASVVVDLGSLQFGQTKDVIAKMIIPPGGSASSCLEASLQYGTRAGGAPLTVASRAVEGAGAGPSGAMHAAAVEAQRCRLQFVDTVREAMKMVKRSKMDVASGKPMPLPDAQAILSKLSDEISASPAIGGNEAVGFLLEDLQGQVAEAFSREDWYTKWGVHYLPSLLGAHLAQVCNNFKDPGVQAYGGDLFGDLRDKADDIFCSLPAPKPSARAPPQPVAAAAVQRASYSAPSPSPVSMSTYYDRYAGCIDGDALVLMADGRERRLAEVRRGDAVSTPGHGSAEVRCVVRTCAPDSRFLLVQMPDGGPKLTPHHPVLLEGAWRFPVDIAPAEERNCEAVFALVLEDGESAAIVAGVPCVSLGHGIEEGAARHAFFGSRAVVEDLEKLPGFSDGLVDLRPGMVKRDPMTGLVCSFSADM